jgi:enterochelin esterase-like enzyme
MNFWQGPLETLHELLRRKAPHLRQIRHFQSFALEREVDFDVYLPPDYRLSPGRRYPLVIFNDGQDLPRMQFARILERLYFEKKIPHIIAVGVYATGERQREYGTARQPDYKGRGDRAGAYSNFVMAELMPYLYLRFRVSDEPEERALAGFSLGGLSAFDMGWAFPRYFGVVGVFSGSFWWRWSPVSPHDPDADRILHDIVWKTPKVSDYQRFWLQCGTLDEEDDRNHNGVIDSIDDTLALIHALRSKGVAEENIRYLEIEGGRHEPATWGEAMPDFLRWAFVREGSFWS